MSETLKQNPSFGIRWDKLPDYSDLSKEQTTFYRKTIDKMVGSFLAFMREPAVSDQYSAKSARDLFMIIGEVAFDLMMAFDLEDSPMVIPTTRLIFPKNRANFSFFNYKGKIGPVIEGNLLVLLKATADLELFRNGSRVPIDYDPDGLITTVLGIAHEMVHYRQEKIPFFQRQSKTAAHQIRSGWERTDENLMNYNKSAEEVHASLIAVKYVMRKKSSTKPFIWDQLDFSQKIKEILKEKISSLKNTKIDRAHELHRQNRFIPLSDGEKRQQIKSELDKLNQQITDWDIRLDTALARIDGDFS